MYVKHECPDIAGKYYFCKGHRDKGQGHSQFFLILPKCAPKGVWLSNSLDLDEMASYFVSYPDLMLSLFMFMCHFIAKYQYM